MAVVTVGLYFWLRNKRPIFKLIPFMIIATILVGLEITKQIYGLYWTYFGDWLPLHVCSIFLFSIPLAVLLPQKSGASKIFWSLSLVVSLMLFVTLVFAPNMVMGSQVQTLMGGEPFYIHLGRNPTLMNVHSVVYHFVAVWFFFLFIALKPVHLNFKYLIFGGGVFAFFLIISWHMTNVFGYEFSSFNMFGSFYDYGFRILPMQFLIWLGHLIAAAVAIALVIIIHKIKEK